MSIEKMEFVTIVGRMKFLNDVLLNCFESECFHIEHANKVVTESDQNFTLLQEQNPYLDLLKRIISIETGDGFNFGKVSVKDVNDMNIEDMDNFITEIAQKFHTLGDDISKLEDNISERKQALVQLTHLKGLRIDVGKLFKCTHIDVRFGRLPCESYQKLAYYDDKTFIFMPYDDDGSYKWGFYFTPKDSVRDTDEIMKSLYFERIWVPDFITGTPETEAEKLKEEISILEKDLNNLFADRQAIIKDKGKMLNMIFCRVKFLYDNFELRKYISVYKDNFYLVGFVPKKDIQRFKKEFDNVPEVSIVSKPAGGDERVEVPVKLKNNRFSKPFSMFVEMYGLPKYNGFNPTNLVAITYTLLFGIMFGDLGQGLVISLIGYIIYKKTDNYLGAIIQRVGLSSAFFGLLFGSFFGFENALDPLYKMIGLKHKPIEVMENTNLILISAISIGVALIIISIIINIIINLKHKNYTDAIFSNNGIAGLVMFGSLLFGLAVMLISGNNIFNAAYIVFLIILPVIIMFFREPLGCLCRGKRFNMEGGIGDFIASNFFEVFEFLLGYASNTLSFVRIGGFVFSHAGMMSVVMLLSESFSKGISPVVIVIGNIFVIGMEGMIVGIQVLRLEFYEIFSRFYDGDGYAFEPVKIKYDTVID